MDQLPAPGRLMAATRIGMCLRLPELALACGLALSMALPARADNPPLPTDGPPPEELEVEAHDGNGELLGYIGTELPHSGWTTFAATAGAYDGIMLYPGGMELAVRAPGCSEACAFPLSPRGVFYCLTLPSGELCMLRLPSAVGAEHGSATLGLRGHNYFMTPREPVAIARLMLSGGPPAGGSSDQRNVRNSFAWADCEALIAAVEERGQDEALTVCGEVVSQMLADYATRAGRYPVSLDELVSGPFAGIHDLPLNPYNAGVSLFKAPGEDSLGCGLVYLAELEGSPADAAVKVVGYWLGAACPDGLADPDLALPAGTPPVQACAWWEAHPTAGNTTI